LTGLLFAAIVATAVPASGQDVTLGYQFQRFSSGGESLNAPLGFTFDFARPVTDTLGAVVQFDWSRRSESETILGTSFEATSNHTTFAGGVRWSGTDNPAATPFLHGLFGLMHTSFGCEVAGTSCAILGEGFDDSSNDPLLQIGGGVAVPMGTWSAVGQVDYRRLFSEDEGVNGLRLVVGVRFTLR
jgi:hypothetical protein